MSATLRVAAFAAALAAVFGAAYGIGRVAPVDPAEAAGGGHEQDERGEAALPGVAVAADGLRLQLADTTLAPGRRPLVFAIVDDEGERVREYDVLHERRMHVVVVQRDLSEFRHVHPRLGADGRWRVDADFAAGVHRVFADFQSDDVRAVLGADVFVGRGAAPTPVPAPSTTAAAGGYVVDLAAPPLEAGEEARLEFAIRRDGRPVTPAPYLGARGHLVVLREGDLAYVHTHAEEDAAAAEFETTLPSAGRYRAYLQFAHGGRVHTVEYTLEAE